MTPLPKLLVIGGSAGSLDVLIQLLPELEPEWPLAMIIVLHRKAGSDTLLSELLSAKTCLSVKEAEEKDMLLPGCIYVAPADYHLLIEPDGSLTLDASEKVHYSRPSIDVTFISAAEVCGGHLYCLLLSGANMDGAEGMQAVHESGGFTSVQDPATAEAPFMPKYAINTARVDKVFNIREMIDFVKGLKA
ncbi:chemotaxis protein CheB [Chitinophaga sp. CF418]|uniref:chemotaxis protein CheB n=1 Tax=Chitinophaga sp. CF418 TaxID=1855287 RepID=UPI00091960BD|nr:chemotaxis protein CheB [Chitinophaga sp. CF418]SHN23000.1 two-component system, chemotaxis family, response regulator CheB [Chitinophaga sp. CF418]